jgi:hypothetical protein
MASHKETRTSTVSEDLKEDLKGSVIVEVGETTHVE